MEVWQADGRSAQSLLSKYNQVPRVQEYADDRQGNSIMPSERKCPRVSVIILVPVRQYRAKPQVQIHH
jgi:hypothetical protein